MCKFHVNRIEWSVVAIFLLLNGYDCETPTPTWSKPEQSLSAQNNDWIPVAGKCATCRTNRDLDAQATNEQINKVLSPPKSQPVLQPHLSSPHSTSPIQFLNTKQSRLLPYGHGASYLHNGNIFSNEKHQLPPTKLFPRDTPKFYQYENSPFVKQPYNLGQQQLQIPQAIPAQDFPQRFSLAEPYPFTLPLKNLDTTTPKVSYQPKIRFPDTDIPKFIPNNKITSQNSEEIQLLYVPIETLQRGRKNMKDLLPQGQQQYAPNVPQGFLSPQYELPYSGLQKQPENPYFFPGNFSPAPNYVQFMNQPLPPKIPEIYTNLSQNVLQPYFTINGLYSPLPQAQQVQQAQQAPTKQPELQYYNLIQPGLTANGLVKPPEQQFRPPEQQFRPPAVNGLPNQYEFVVPSNPSGLLNLKSNVNSYEAYAPTTAEPIRNNQFKTSPDVRFKDFDYQYVTGSPQSSASQNQNFIYEQSLKQASRPVQQLRPTAYDDISANYPVPHQPPLSFYMEKIQNPKINDVLYLLKDAKTIPVLDAVENDPPQVFVGPSELQAPAGYIKFELPYLSNLDYNRIERMIDKLPFFVAPLNFKPPPGYSKIPFPAPHIGSVVLSNSTTIRESLHEKPFEQKLRPASQAPDFSTNTPQLTSQINSLVDTPSSAPADPLAFREQSSYQNPTAKFEQTPTKQYNSDEVTKKPYIKTTQQPAITEQPKRVANRQRKPIYRGYPTTTETSRPPVTTPVTTTAELTIPLKDSNEYVEVSAKGTFNVNPTNANSPSSNTIEQQTSTVQPPSDSIKPNLFDGVDFYTSKQQQNQNVNYFPANDQNYPYFVNSKPSQQKPTQNNYATSNDQNYPFDSQSSKDTIPSQKNNFDQPSFVSQTPTEKNDASQSTSSSASLSPTKQHNANYPFIDSIKPLPTSEYYTPSNEPTNLFNSPSSNDVRLPDTSKSNIGVTDTSQSNVNNFSNIKPLSQYDPFVKSPASSLSEQQNATESSLSVSTNNQDYSFWNHNNQFYNANPATVDYFTSPATNQVPDTPSTEKPTTASEYVSTATDYSSTEASSASPFRPKHKQRVQNRYHQFRVTTEKDGGVSSESTTLPDSVSQPTESNVELSTKYRRRRPNRPQNANDSNASTARNYRIRTTKFPISSTTERYRLRKPTARPSIAENSNPDYNNAAPSAPATNDIQSSSSDGTRPRIAAVDENNNFHPYYHHKIPHTNQPLSNNQVQSQEFAHTTLQVPVKIYQDESGSNTESSSYLDTSKHNLPSTGLEYTPQFLPNIQSQQYLIDENTVRNRTEESVKRKDEQHEKISQQHILGHPKTENYEEVNDYTAPSSVNHDTEYKESVYQNEKTNYDQESKDKFLTKDNADQKKAYDPQDEKKGSGRRRITFIRRIKVPKRPHGSDVFETAESQNLGRISENSVQTADSKQLSKTEEKDSSSSFKIKSNGNSDSYVSSTVEYNAELDDIKTTTILPSNTQPAVEADDYANLQNNFAQMLSDFLNSNDKSAKTVNNIERHNLTENSIGFILGLDDNKNRNNNVTSSDSIIATPSTSPTENAIVNDEIVTLTSGNFAHSNTEFVDRQITTDESSISQTTIPNKLLGTSTTTEISLETEICYRGKCVKTKKSKASDLLPVE